MPYVDGFVIAVPKDKKSEYRDMSAKAWRIFKEAGATRQVECWGDDVRTGETTDFRGAVKAKDGEEIVFSWVEYPSKEARDRANQKMRDDPSMKEMGDSMPFDGKRMIFGGFTPILDERA